MVRNALIGFAVLALSVGPLAFFVQLHRVRSAGERVIAKGLELERARFTRASHLPEPGDVRARAEAAIAKAPIPPLLTWPDACRPVTPELRLEELHERCRAMWAAQRWWVIELMRASRGEQFSPLTLVTGNAMTDDYTLEAKVAVRFSYELVVLELQNSTPEEGVRLCLDSIAFARDLVPGSGWVGAIAGANYVRDLSKPCAAVFAAAPPELRAWAKRSLEGVQMSWPVAGSWAGIELVNSARHLTEPLSDDQLRRWPKALRPKPGHPDRTLYEKLLDFEILPAMVAEHEGLERAGRLPRPDRDRLVKTIEDSARSAWNPRRRRTGYVFQPSFRTEDEGAQALADLIRACSP